MKTSACLVLCFAMSAVARAEVPGEFRPRPVVNITQEVECGVRPFQPPGLEPRSRTGRKPRLTDKGRPERRGSELVFRRGWELAEAPWVNTNGAALSRPGVDTREWYDATVPGTVLTTLVDQGVYPDPYYGLNNLRIPEGLARQDYWYRTEFELPPEWAGRELWLRFEGINHYAEVWLNGAYLGHVAGAFRRGEFNVTRQVQPGGTNVLAVMIAPPPTPGGAHEQSVKGGMGKNGSTLCLDGPTFVCTDGWDWIPNIRDRCAGIWQDVVLRATGPVTLDHPRVVTRLPLPEVSSADVMVSAEVRNATGTNQTGMLRGSFEGVTFEQAVSLGAGEVRTVTYEPGGVPQLKVAQPRLWWPNGYGKPELYHLTLAFETGSGVSDEAGARFGIREFSYELGVGPTNAPVRRVEFFPTRAKADERVIDCRRSTLNWDPKAKEPPIPVGLWPGAETSPAVRFLPDEGMGVFLVLKVNGRRVFCRGGNWGMDDAMKRVSRERLEPFMRLHRDAGFNLVRNWGGQSTERAFFDLCDEYGLLVWNDLWLNNEFANFEPADEALFLANAADTMKRFRNHPSLALWCPRNEGMPNERLNTALEQMVRELDGTRYYQPNSRIVSTSPSGPWANWPLAKYFTQVNTGFSTEVGACSVPSAEAMRTMMDPADLWPPGDVWAYHDFHSSPWAANRDGYLKTLARQYGDLTGLDDFCKKAQLLNYTTHRAMFEGFNARMWKGTSGLLVWMSHPAWPSVSYQLYSWDGEPNGAYFGAQKASAPVHVQMNLPDCRLAVVNHTESPLAGVTLRGTVHDLAGKVVQTVETNLTAGANQVTEGPAFDWPTNGVFLAKLELRDGSGAVMADNFYWHARDDAQFRALSALPPARLEVEVRRGGTNGEACLVATFVNRGRIPALAVRPVLRDAATGKRRLPAYYSDGLFSLLPGERRTVRVGGAGDLRGAVLSVDGWNVKAVTAGP